MVISFYGQMYFCMAGRVFGMRLVSNGKPWQDGDSSVLEFLSSFKGGASCNRVLRSCLFAPVPLSILRFTVRSCCVTLVAGTILSERCLSLELNQLAFFRCHRCAIQFSTIQCFHLVLLVTSQGFCCDMVSQ